MNEMIMETRKRGTNRKNWLQSTVTQMCVIRALQNDTHLFLEMYIYMYLCTKAMRILLVHWLTFWSLT